MKRNLTIGILAASVVGLMPGLSAADGHGLVVQKSQHDVATTTERLVTVINKKGLKHFATIDHAAGAAKAGHELPGTTLVIFGNPKIGTPLMKCSRTVAIDLPQKALIWENADGVWIGYNAPKYLDGRHGLSECAGVLKKVAGALAGLTGFACIRNTCVSCAISWRTHLYQRAPPHIEGTI
ncbi:MAG: DUF302 domain-containing protein [Pseudomonadota bacterium]